MNTTATWYRMGNVQSGEYVGCLGYDGGPVVGRFAFTTGSQGASAMSFQSLVLGPTGMSTWSSGNPDAFRFLLGTDPDQCKSRCSNSGTPVTIVWGDSNRMTGGGSRSVQLMPNTTYYLWIYPSTSSYNLWDIGGITVTLSGSYGNPATPSAPNGSFGETVTILLSGGSAGAVYTVKASCAGKEETLQSRASATVLSWLPTAATYAPLVTDADSAIARITVETWYGSLLVGTRSCELTLRFRAEDVGVELQSGWVTHSPYNEGRASAIALYIRGISRSEIRFDTGKIVTKYGASVAGYTLSCGGSTVSQSPWRTPVLGDESTVTVTVRDSRGFAASESFTISPLPYRQPALSNVSVFRCTEQGTAAEDGCFLSLQATAVCSELEGANSAAIRYRIRPVTGSFGGAADLPSGTALLVPGLAPDTSYEAELSVSDTVGGSGVFLYRIPGRRWAMKLHPRGEGVGFGMAPQAAKRLEIPANWEILRGEERYVPLAESGSSGIWRWQKWADGSFALQGAKLVTADFDSAWGTLYRGTVLNAESFPFPVTAIDYASAVIADSTCFALGNMGMSLTDTGQIMAVSAEPRTQASLPLRLLVLGRWR